MGTHDRRLRLSERTDLEVIAVDPGAPRPRDPRWLGLDRAEMVGSDWVDGMRLRAWVARTDRIDAVLAVRDR